MVRATTHFVDLIFLTAWINMTWIHETSWTKSGHVCFCLPQVFGSASKQLHTLHNPVLSGPAKRGNCTKILLFWAWHILHVVVTRKSSWQLAAAMTSAINSQHKLQRLRHELMYHGGSSCGVCSKRYQQLDNACPVPRCSIHQQRLTLSKQKPALGYWD